MNTLFNYVQKNINFNLDYFYFRLYHYDEHLYSKLEIYNDIMTDVHVFFTKNIKRNNYKLDLNDDLKNIMSNLNNKLKYLKDNHNDFISKFDDNNFNIMFSNDYLDFLRKTVDEDYIYISSYIMKYSKCVRFSMINELKKLKSHHIVPEEESVQEESVQEEEDEVVEQENDRFVKCDECLVSVDCHKNSIHIVYKGEPSNLTDEKTLCNMCFNEQEDDLIEDGFKCDDWDIEEEEVSE